MNLSDDDLETIRHAGYFRKLNLSIGDYYVKMVCKSSEKFSFLNELIGEKLASIFDLICPEYHILTVDDDNYILSNDLNLLGDFKTAEQMGLENENNSLTDILDFLMAKLGDINMIDCDVVKYIFWICFFQIQIEFLVTGE